MPEQPALTKGQRIKVIALITASLTCTVLLVGGYLYARSYDPWLTPRRTHYMILFEGIRHALEELHFCLILGNAGMAYLISIRRWRVACLVCVVLGTLAEWVMCQAA